MSKKEGRMYRRNYEFLTKELRDSANKQKSIIAHAKARLADIQSARIDVFNMMRGEQV